MQEIEIKCKGADSLSIDTIKDFQGKLKRISRDNLERLKVSILKNGFVAPIFVWRNEGQCMALDGHQRIKALLSMRDEGYNIPLLPIAYIEANNEEDARQKLLAITSQYGEFDIDELNSWVNNLDAEIAETLRFVDDKIELDIEEIETEGDDEFEDEIEPITKLGDLWELGNHRVLCGDSTDSGQVEILMDGQKADTVFTDPPYGMNLDTDWSDAKSNLKFYKEKGRGGGNKYEKVKGDNDDFTPALIDTVFDNFGYCKEIFMWGADYYAEYLINKNDGSWVVWDKRSNEGTDVDFVKQSDKMFGSCFELCWSKAKHRRILARIKWAGIFGTEKEFDRKRHHPTQKPIALVDWFFEHYLALDKKIVVDLYGGSGGVLISSEKNNKQCFMMELDPHYCDVIVKRYTDWCIKNEREYIIKLNGEAWQ